MPTSQAYPVRRSRTLNVRCRRITDRALYIYTSGTTGLPKAANVSHFRLMQWSHWFAGLLDTRATDRMYNCLPMYHSVGGVVAVGATLVNGGSVFLRQGFSARRFWDDIVAKDCTLFQYIGELCRFLMQCAAAAACRSSIASGFAAATACAATSGSPSRSASASRRSWSSTRRPKPISRSTTAKASRAQSAAFPRFSRIAFPVPLVKFDVASGEPVRNAEGFCERCGTGRGGRGDQQDFGERRGCGRALRRLYRRRCLRAQSPAQCLRRRRCLVSHPAI